MTEADLGDAELDPKGLLAQAGLPHDFPDPLADLVDETPEVDEQRP